MLGNLLSVLTGESSSEIIIASILSIASILFVIIKVFFKVWNRTSFEKMLTPKYDAIWEDFLELIFITIILTFGVILAGYSIGVRFNVFDSTWLKSLLWKAWLGIMVVCIFVVIISLIPKMKRFIQQNHKLKKVIWYILIFSYVSVLFTIIILVSLHVSNAQETDTSLYNQLLIILFIGIINVILFTIITKIVWHISREFHLLNTNQDIYKVSKINSNQLNNLYFIYAMKEDVHILSETKDFNENDLSAVFVYYVKEDILLEYQKRSLITLEETKR